MVEEVNIMNYIISVKDLNFEKSLYVPSNTNIQAYIDEWLFAEYGIKDKSYQIKESA